METQKNDLENTVVESTTVNNQEPGDRKYSQRRRPSNKKFGNSKNLDANDFNSEWEGNREGNRVQKPDRVEERIQQMSGPTYDLSPINYEEKKFNSRNRLYIGNIGGDITEQDIVKFFEPYGEITEVFLNKEKNFGFIKFDYHVNAEKAKRELDGTSFKQRNLKVRFSPTNASIKVKNLTPLVTNELLAYAFSAFGEIERAVVLTDEKGKSIGEGFVDFSRKISALTAIRKCQESCFFLTSSLRPVIVEPHEAVEDKDGLSDKNVNKKSAEFCSEREAGPRLAFKNSFEEIYGMKWKNMFEIHKQKEEALKKEFQLEMDNLVAQMEYARYEHETEVLREQLRIREMDKERQKREWEMKQRQVEQEKLRSKELLKSRQENMQALLLDRQDEIHRRQQESELFMQAHNLDSILDQQEQVYTSPYTNEEVGQTEVSYVESQSRHSSLLGFNNTGHTSVHIDRGRWVTDTRRDEYGPTKRRRF